jgi:cytochrome c553
MAWRLAPTATLSFRTLARNAAKIGALVMVMSPTTLMPPPSAAAEGSATADRQGAELAATCASCHRLDGLDQGIPSIISLDANKLIDMMAAFKSGKRASQIMQVVARSLSDEETATVARYLASRQKRSEQP